MKQLNCFILVQSNVLSRVLGRDRREGTSDTIWDSVYLNEMICNWLCKQGVEYVCFQRCICAR
jgi:hypothetical protein